MYYEQDYDDLEIDKNELNHLNRARPKPSRKNRKSVKININDEIESDNKEANNIVETTEVTENIEIDNTFDKIKKVGVELPFMVSKNQLENVLRSRESRRSCYNRINTDPVDRNLINEESKLKQAAENEKSILKLNNDSKLKIDKKINFNDKDFVNKSNNKNVKFEDEQIENEDNLYSKFGLRRTKSFKEPKISDITNKKTKQDFITNNTSTSEVGLKNKINAKERIHHLSRERLIENDDKKQQSVINNDKNLTKNSELMNTKVKNLSTLEDHVNVKNNEKVTKIESEIQTEKQKPNKLSKDRFSMFITSTDIENFDSATSKEELNKNRIKTIKKRINLNEISNASKPDVNVTEIPNKKNELSELVSKIKIDVEKLNGLSKSNKSSEDQFTKPFEDKNKNLINEDNNLKNNNKIWPRQKIDTEEYKAHANIQSNEINQNKSTITIVKDKMKSNENIEVTWKNKSSISPTKVLISSPLTDENKNNKECLDCNTINKTISNFCKECGSKSFKIKNEPTTKNIFNNNDNKKNKKKCLICNNETSLDICPYCGFDFSNNNNNTSDFKFKF